MLGSALIALLIVAAPDPRGALGDAAEPRSAACRPAVEVRGADVPTDVVRDFRAAADHALDAIRAQTGDDDCRPITITLVPSMGRADELDPPWHLPSWAAGAARPAERRIVVGITSNGRVQDRLVTLTHELAHVSARSAAGGAALPRWLDEGIARVVAGEHGIADMQELARARVADRFLPLTALEDGFPAGARDAALAYAQAGRAVSLAVERDPGAISLILHHFRSGLSADDALRQATGRATWQVDLDVRRSVGLWAAIAVVGVEGDLAMASCGLAVAYFGVRARRRQRERLSAMDDAMPARTVVDAVVARWTVRGAPW